ncbi:MAG: PilZ domain-containing protein [Desulfobacteraceae bacterium]|nr:PilZ domain-containing protein [Desulfobacteraceae bacterium]
MKARDLDDWTNMKNVCYRKESGGEYVLNERKDPRMYINDEILYRRELNGDEYRGKFYDVSKSGMSMISQYPYLSGTKLYLRTMDDSSGKLERGDVVWAKRDVGFSAKTPKYRVGIKFASF